MDSAVRPGMRTTGHRHHLTDQPKPAPTNTSGTREQRGPKIIPALKQKRHSNRNHYRTRRDSMDRGLTVKRTTILRLTSRPSGELTKSILDGAVESWVGVDHLP